jgi:uracil-DNA glycosylase
MAAGGNPRDKLRALLADGLAFGVLGFGPPPRRANAAPEPQQPGAPLDRVAALARVADEAGLCRRCPLGKSRTNAVPGQGNPAAELMFIGEAPGADEDAKGLAFVGAAGQLLTKMIAAMGFDRSEVFIANVLKCRPPDNREPQPDEVAACLPFLERQIAIVQPRVICALGAHAARNLLNTEVAVGKLRGVVHAIYDTQVVVTYHPAYLLRSPGEKVKAWEDLKLVLDLLGRKPPAKP